MNARDEFEVHLTSAFVIGAAQNSTLFTILCDRLARWHARDEHEVHLTNAHILNHFVRPPCKMALCTRAEKSALAT